MNIMRFLNKLKTTVARLLGLGVGKPRVRSQKDAQEAERLDRLRNPSKYQGR